MFLTFLTFSKIECLKLKNPEISYCQEGSEDWFTNIQVSIKPWPMHVVTGETFTFNGGVDILQTIENGSFLKIDVTLISDEFGELPVPCYQDLFIGSCQYKVAEILEKLDELKICEILMAKGTIHTPRGHSGVQGILRKISNILPKSSKDETEKGLKVAEKWPKSGRKVVKKWPKSGRKVAEVAKK